MTWMAKLSGMMSYGVLLWQGGPGDHMRHHVSLAEVDACPFHLALELQSRTLWYQFYIDGLHFSSH
jgi:hypothetical protein